MRLHDLMAVLARLPQDVETDMKLVFWFDGKQIVLSDAGTLYGADMLPVVDIPPDASKRKIYELLQEKS